MKRSQKELFFQIYLMQLYQQYLGRKAASASLLPLLHHLWKGSYDETQLHRKCLDFLPRPPTLH